MEATSTIVYIMFLASLQNVAFSLVSRARNRDNVPYHVICSVLSNSIFFLTFRELVLSDMTWQFFLPYVAGTVFGSVFGVTLAMKIEKRIGALADPKLPTN